MMNVRTQLEQHAYEMGQENRRRGLTIKESDLLVGRRFGIVDWLLAIASEGWYAEDERLS